MSGMGAQCATVVCKEVGLASPESSGHAKDIKFWHEKMRFSQASQTLFDASVHGDATLASQAVRNLGDPNCCSRRGYRPLQVAISCGNAQLVDILVKAGADINGHSKDTPPPLVLAAGNKDDKAGDIFLALLEHGADLNVAEDLSGETALTRAADRGQQAIVQIILSRGSIGYQKLLAQRPRTGPQGDGSTALHLAAGKGHRSICDRLLGVGSDPNHMNKRGRMPLHRAAEGNHVEVASLLVSFGALPLSQDRAGLAPIHTAAENGFLSMADLLVRFKADVNVRRNDGIGPLHLAAQGGHDMVCNLLLAHGSEPNVQDEAGETPMSLALVKGHVRCCKILLEGGAEVKAVDSQRWVPPYTEMHPEEHARFRKGSQSGESPRGVVTC